MRWVWFREWLLEVKRCNPELSRVAYEEVVNHGPVMTRTAHVYGGFEAMVQMFACHHDFELIALNVATLKKQWTGSGRADKKQMIARCKELGFNPADDNEADAIALLHIVCGTAPLLTPTIAKRKPKEPIPFLNTTGPNPF